MLFAACPLSIMDDAHADLALELGSPFLFGGVFSGLAPLSNLVFQRLEADVLEPCVRARDGEDAAVGCCCAAAYGVHGGHAADRLFVGGRRGWTCTSPAGWRDVRSAFVGAVSVHAQAVAEQEASAAAEPGHAHAHVAGELGAWVFGGVAACW